MNLRIAASLLVLGLVAFSRPAAIAAESAATVSVPSPAEILSTLKSGHPRLFLSQAGFDSLRTRVAADPQLKAWHARLKEQGERTLKDAPSKYEIPDGLRLLSTSRRVLQRTQLLALLFRLEGDRRFAERAWRELEAAAAFTNWNPRHFLDTAEMTHAFAVGYDWLHDFWTPAQRTTLRTAMLEKGLTPARDILAKNTGWARSRHNWNQVCNGGIGIGALALADELPELAGEILSASARSIQLAMAEFAPDGAWAEGPGYWNYATTYNIAFLAALQTALGTDFGLSGMPGFAEAGTFPIHLTGPLGRTFNYADGGDGTIRAPHLYWMARQFHRPEYAAYQTRVASPGALDLLWFDAKLSEGAAAVPLDRYFRNAEVVTLRSAWDDRNAVFIGFKAGDNKANHSNLDLGTFVLDALGTRWAVDLGADDYNLPGYFGGQRWNYYRMRAEGHNTLVINPGAPPDQDPRAATRVDRFESKPDRALAISDLSAAYAGAKAKARRGIALLNRRQVLVQDEVQAGAPAEVWWFLHTPAQAAADARTATLSQGSNRLFARILSPETATFTVRDATPLPSSPNPEKQNRNTGIRKLAIHVKAATNLKVAVLLVPLKAGESMPQTMPAVRPLSEW